MLRTVDPRFAHVGQLWQALYYTPQVRHRISQYRGPPPPEGVTEVDPPAVGIGISSIWLQSFANFHLYRGANLVCARIVWVHGTIHPGDSRRRTSDKPVPISTLGEYFSSRRCRKCVSLRSFSHLLTDTLLRGIQGLCRTSRTLPEWWPCHQTSGLAEVNFGTITVPCGFEACVFMPQVIPLTHRQRDT